MVESGRVPGTGRIRASTGKGSNLCEYQKLVETGLVPGKGRIHESIEKFPGEYLQRVESV